eukprot:3046613-Pyramimonas_sp.AAC.1
MIAHGHQALALLTIINSVRKPESSQQQRAQRLLQRARFHVRQGGIDRGSVLPTGTLCRTIGRFGRGRTSGGVTG